MRRKILSVILLLGIISFQIWQFVNAIVTVMNDAEDYLNRTAEVLAYVYFLLGMPDPEQPDFYNFTAVMNKLLDEQSYIAFYENDVLQWTHPSRALNVAPLTPPQETYLKAFVKRRGRYAIIFVKLIGTDATLAVAVDYTKNIVKVSYLISTFFITGALLVLVLFKVVERWENGRNGKASR